MSKYYNIFILPNFIANFSSLFKIVYLDLDIRKSTLKNKNYI